MRVRVDVDAAWQVTITVGPNAPFSRGTLRRVPVEPAAHVFPLPPEGEGCSYLAPALAPADQLAAACADLTRDYEAIVNRSPRSARTFGRYLFDTLLGKAWAEIEKQTKGGEIELTLCWAHDLVNLHRLNWEMMHDGTRFLAERIPLVAITRMVKGAQGSAAAIAGPPRVLFVIGTRLAGSDLRPGAEYLGLLRQLGSDNRGRCIHSRILHDEASSPVNPKRIEEVVKEFRPDVVHFIGHGGRNGNEGFLQLAPDSGKQTRECNAETLVGALGKTLGLSLPQIVVLGACDSASANPANPQELPTEEAASLAAELVMAGVPVVVGMAGRVADRACRLFTRRFGAALIDGVALAKATAQGRLAAFQAGALNDTVIDWAFPVVFLAEQVAEGFAPVCASAGDWDPERRIRDYNLLQNPVFFGREEFVEAYYKTLAGPYALLIWTETPEVGRTRVLHELVAQSIRDGHIPCLIDPRVGGTTAGGVNKRGRRRGGSPLTEPTPGTLTRLALAVVRAITQTRKVFEIPRWDSRLLNILRARHEDPELEAFGLNPAVSSEHFFAAAVQHYNEAEDDLLDDHQIRGLLQEDLAALASDWKARAATTRAEWQGAGRPIPRWLDTAATAGRAVVFFNWVEAYGPDLTGRLLGTILGATQACGLGTVQAPVPVVLTYRTEPNDRQFEYIVTTYGGSHVRTIELKPLESGYEEMLAAGQVLLRPFDHDGQQLPQFSNRAWAINSQIGPTALALAQLLFSQMIQGLPGNLGTRLFYQTVSKAHQEVQRANQRVGAPQAPELLVPANDEIVLQAILAGGGP
jgi:hypothetical protein